MSKKISLALVVSMLAALASAAQEKDKDKEKDKQEVASASAAREGPRKAQTPLRLLIVFSRYQGEKKVSSMPYTLAVSAPGRPTRLRMGIQVPIQVKDTPQYRDVGNNLDCSAEPVDGGRFWVACTLEQSIVYSAEGDRRAAGSAIGEVPLSSVPLIRNFRSEANLTLRDGQTALLLAATDPVSGEVLKVDLTLDVMR